MTAEDFYRQGNEYRRMGHFKEALECYMQAIAFDPQSPAVTAKQMLDEQFAFFCKDYYNP